MHEGELVESQWLLAYEANVKGWLPNKDGKDFVAADEYFGPMKAAGVSFYDVTATLAIAVKHAVSIEYEPADHLELELAHFFADVSG